MKKRLTSTQIANMTDAQYTKYAKSHKCDCGLTIDACGDNCLAGKGCKAAKHQMTVRIVEK